jgi:hypothetical protein
MRGDFHPRTEIREKPQIAQISQMTEAREFSAKGRKNSSGTKRSRPRLWLFHL